ncbi:MAG: extracellular solute-binding protein [Oscillospiraceae bacterium]|nr:extracellular solute-binding protein [Oscillospiraceae bacterium]
MKSFFKKALILLVMISGLVLLSSCAQEQAQPAQTGTQPAQADEQQPQTNGQETIVLYSNALSDGRGDWIAERALADLDIVVLQVDGGGVDIANRLVAERDNPQADVLFGFNPMLWWQLEDNDIIVPHTPPWAGEIPVGNHADGLFHAVILVGNMLIYDQNQIGFGDTPGDWLDLWQNPYFHGRYAVPDALGGSTVQMVLSGIFNRFIDPAGHLGVSAEGWENIAAKFRHGVSTNQDMAAEISGPSDAVMSQMWSHGIPVREEQFGISAGFASPGVGVPFSIEGVALVNGASNPEAARRFIDWFGQAEVMHDFSAEFGFVPAHPAALEGLPPFNSVIAGLPHQQIDWDFIAPRMGDWLEHILLNYMQ